MKRDDRDATLEDLLRERYDFARWRGTSRRDGALFLWRFTPLPGALPGWQTEKIRRLPVPDAPPATRSTWTSKERSDALLVVDTVEAPSRPGAHDLLIEALAQFQSPDLARDDRAALGDVSFYVPHGSAKIWAQGNVVVMVRNGGREIVDVTDAADALDRWMAEPPESTGGNGIPGLRLPVDGALPPGGSVPVELNGSGDDGRVAFFKLYANRGDFAADEGRVVYGAPEDTGPVRLRIYAVAEDGTATSTEAELQISG